MSYSWRISGTWTKDVPEFFHLIEAAETEVLTASHAAGSLGLVPAVHP
jgi:hypothetical protein